MELYKIKITVVLPLFAYLQVSEVEGAYTKYLTLVINTEVL